MVTVDDANAPVVATISPAASSARCVFLSVNIDFMRMYRPQTNVVTRPVAGTNGSGISLLGHHEILIPLMAAAIVEAV